MPDELKIKLRELLVTQHLGKYMRNADGDFVPVTEGPLLDEYVAETEQAFKDAGWYHSPLVEYQMNRIDSGELMTGQEFYSRFDKALEDVDEDNEWLPQHEHEILEAARRAAGLAEGCDAE